MALLDKIKSIFKRDKTKVKAEQLKSSVETAQEKKTEAAENKSGEARQ